MNRPHFRRRGRAWRLRPADPELLSRLDRLDGLPRRTRYDAEWPDVRAAEAGGWAGGDLAAMAAPKWADLYGIDPEFPGGDLAAMAAPADYGVGYAIESEERAVVEPGLVWVRLAADVNRFTDAMAKAQAAITAATKPRGRHRQTDPADLILADLRDIEDRLS